MSRGLSIYQEAVLQWLKERGSMNILEVCTLIIRVHGKKKDPSFKPDIWTRIESLEELGNDTHGMYRMMRSLEKRGLIARLLHRRPAVWYKVSWHDGRPRLEQGSNGWYDFNHVMYRDGQVLFQTKEKKWIIRGVKMSSAQIRQRLSKKD